MKYVEWYLHILAFKSTWVPGIDCSNPADSNNPMI